MIHYEHGNWGVGFVFRIRGSVLPRALVWAFPSAIFAVALHRIKTMQTYYDLENTSGGNVMMTFSTFVTVLGFLVVFRSNQAWSRYWDGANSIEAAQSAWLNATSNIMAFTSRKEEDADKVKTFQNLIVRLMSLLYGSALETLSESSRFEILDLTGIEKERLRFLETDIQSQGIGKCECILQWIQRSVVENMDVLPIPPPILSRVFQELGQGIVFVTKARKIKELPVPFHYAQMMSLMLITYACGVPPVAAYTMDSSWGAGGATFLNVFVLWSINYLAAEIEMPYGDDWNDLPLDANQIRMNTMLKMFLRTEVQDPPDYDLTPKLARQFTNSPDQISMRNLMSYRNEVKMATAGLVAVSAFMQGGSKDKDARLDGSVAGIAAIKWKHNARNEETSPGKEEQHNNNNDVEVQEYEDDASDTQSQSSPEPPARSITPAERMIGKSETNTSSSRLRLLDDEVSPKRTTSSRLRGAASEASTPSPTALAVVKGEWTGVPTSPSQVSDRDEPPSKSDPEFATILGRHAKNKGMERQATGNLERSTSRNTNRPFAGAALLSDQAQ